MRIESAHCVSERERGGREFLTFSTPYITCISCVYLDTWHMHIHTHTRTRKQVRTSKNQAYCKQKMSWILFCPQGTLHSLCKMKFCYVHYNAYALDIDNYMMEISTSVVCKLAGYGQMKVLSISNTSPAPLQLGSMLSTFRQECQKDIVTVILLRIPKI